jgi:hypothetical protein
MLKPYRFSIKKQGQAVDLGKSGQAVQSPNLMQARCRLLERTPRQNHPLGQLER